MYYEFFFFNDTATTEIYTLSLHDALPISGGLSSDDLQALRTEVRRQRYAVQPSGPKGSSDLEASNPAHQLWLQFGRDRKSTRLNSSHANISYAVFCLKKKTK